MILKLAKPNNPILKQKANHITAFDNNLKSLMADLSETLAFNGGLGIAAPQVGQPYALFLVSLPSHPAVYINPKIVKYSSKLSEMEEGCLSLPGYRGIVTRPIQVTMDYQDKSGKKKTIKASKLLARIIQHETDHLRGVLYIDRMTDKSKLFKVIPLRIVFFGTPETSLPVLSRLIGLKQTFDYEVVGVVSNSENTPVGSTARKFDIPIVPVDNLKSLRDVTFLEKIKSFKPDLFVVMSFRRILPPELLAIPKYGSINVHFSLLPKYRGATPVQTALLNGEEKTGVTLFLMNEKIDEGDVLAQKEVIVEEEDNFQSLSHRLAGITSTFLVGVMNQWINRRIKPQPQDHSRATYTKILTKEDGLFDPENPPTPEKLKNMIRAFYPWPGVWTTLKIRGTRELRVKLLPGKKVQIEGKKPVPLEEFKRGYPEFRLDW